MSIARRVVVACMMLVTAVVIVGCGPSPRPAKSMSELLAARQADDADREATSGRLIRGLLARARAKYDAMNAVATTRTTGTTPASSAPSTRPTIDLLVISGGGDWGAFGAGVLKGWGKVSGDMARPQFDVVTGVSTGALIAPLAFLGDDVSIERINHLYRHPRKDWVKSRGVLYFWPTNPSFYELPGLERELKREIDDATLARIAEQGRAGRYLLVNTTNVDFGDMHAWDIAQESDRALQARDPDHVRRILLASAGIPAVFPARGIDGCLYVDGAITGNILYGGRVREDQSLWALWQASYPNDPPPRVRYWVIFNNQLRFPPQVTQPKWPEIISRATFMSTQTSTVNSMRHLFAQATIARLKRGADVEVRLMCVPDDWMPPNENVFDKKVMNELADIGERMGADPSSWRTEAP